MRYIPTTSEERERMLRTIGVGSIEDLFSDIPTAVRLQEPLRLKPAIMIEPTETESLQTLDEFIEAMIAIDREARDTPGLVNSAPHTTTVKRLDEVRVARQPDLRWRPGRGSLAPKP